MAQCARLLCQQRWMDVWTIQRTKPTKLHRPTHPPTQQHHERCGLFGQHKDVDAEHSAAATLREASPRAVPRPAVGGTVLGCNSGAANNAAGGFSSAGFQTAVNDLEEQQQRYGDLNVRSQNFKGICVETERECVCVCFRLPRQDYISSA